jgi:hypothetical protein
VALHRLVGIHGVQAGRIEAGEPHVAHDHDLEGVGSGTEAVGRGAALELVEESVFVIVTLIDQTAAQCLN